MPKRRLTPQAPSNLADLLEAEERIKGFIAGASGGSGPLTDAIRTGAQRTCDAVSAAPGAIPDALSLVSVARLCRQYWQDNGYSEPEEDVPFFGGQCDGVSYDVTVDRIVDGVNNATNTVILIGPLSNPRVAPVSATQERFFIDTGVGTKNIYPAYDNGRLQVVVVSVVRSDGLPDNCGNPPGGFKPGPNPAPDPGPTFQPEFEPQLPGVPFFEIPDTYTDPITGPQPVPDVDGDGPGEAQPVGDGGGGPISDLPKTEGTPIVGDDSSDGDVDFGEPPPNEVWVGFHLRVFTAQPFQPPIPGSEANKAYPRPLGNAAIKIEGESGPRASLQEVVRSERGTYIVPDYGLQVGGAYVNVIPGFQYEVIPLSVKVSDPLEV